MQWRLIRKLVDVPKPAARRPNTAGDANAAGEVAATLPLAGSDPAAGENPDPSNRVATEGTPPPSDSTLSLKDSLETSDDTATPSDEGLPPLTPPS